MLFTHTCIVFLLSNQSVLVESPVSLAVSPGVISLDPSLSESPLSAPTSSVSPAVGRKGGASGGKKGKKKKDPNEPQKPVSAYALFFKDTQAAIKGQNPNATFGEVSKIVASMWDSLGEEQKQVRGKFDSCSHGMELLKFVFLTRSNCSFWWLNLSYVCCSSGRSSSASRKYDKNGKNVLFYK